MFSSSTSGIKLESNDFSATGLLAGTKASKKGWLEKAPPKGQKSGAAKTRFFALHSNCLFYFGDENMKSVVGMIFLEGSTVEAVLGDSGQHLIRVVSVGGREYLLRSICSEVSDAEADQQSWVRELQTSQFHTMRSSLAAQQQRHSIVESEASSLAVARDQALKEVASIAASRDQAIRELDAMREREKAALAKAAEEAALRQQGSTAAEELAASIAAYQVERARLEEELQASELEADLLRQARGLRPPRHGDSVESTVPGEEVSKWRMWIGTWNLGASEPFDPHSGAGARLLRESFMTGEAADIYCLGLQEGISESVFNAAEALVAILASCERLPLSTQSSGSDASPDKIHGRGDGSLVGTKFTGLAIYVKKYRLKDVKVLACDKALLPTTRMLENISVLIYCFLNCNPVGIGVRAPLAREAWFERRGSCSTCYRWCHCCAGHVPSRSHES